MKLALFPLSLVVFPGEDLNLHIFEPRYKQLILDAQRDNIKFGIPTYKEEDNMTHGTEVELLQIVKSYPDGKMDVKTKGLRVFKLLDFNPKKKDKLYPEGDVKFLNNYHDPDLGMSSLILERVKILYEIMKIGKSLPKLNPEFSVYDIAHKIGLNLQQEKELLLMAYESHRQNYVLDHLNALIPVVTEMEAMRKKIQMNGHFKNITPPKV